MIANIAKSAGNGALNYNFDKLDKETELIDSNLNNTSKKYVTAKFDDISSRNSRVKKNVFHASLSLANGEHLENDKFAQLGRDYMQKMGFKNSPYVTFMHSDTENQHIHVVASRVDFEGKCVSDKYERRKSMKVLRELEKKYDLKPVKSTKQGYDKKNLKEVNANKYSSVFLVKSDLKNVLNHNLKSCDTQKEFENKCKQNNVYLRVLNGEYTYGGKNSSTKEKIYFKEKQLPQKLSYQAINQHFKRIEREKSNTQQLVEKPQQEKQKKEIVIEIQIPAKRKEPIQDLKKEHRFAKVEKTISKGLNYINSIFSTKEEQKPRDESKKQTKQENTKVQEPQQPQQIKNICTTIEDSIINGGDTGLDKVRKMLENYSLTDNDAIKIAQSKKLDDTDRILILSSAGKSDFWKHSPEEQNRQRKLEEAKTERQQIRQNKPTKNRNRGYGKGI